ncbi:MAG: hypothetical protein GWO20_02335 [Candidatus Korarchaeota archaeon]|nr:hypothetical protein [Candidatus Korarchaeota archaeon]NIU82319.1 hypothetical protein [Candidatus Thorarchaeota archaeon]NIW12802.1 hypothetical protein [Candidatus Thorarchaeota archaeon]NIW51003.1 hypothetical protein [Candidatus Korarchaeota archaeon]
MGHVNQLFNDLFRRSHFTWLKLYAFPSYFCPNPEKVKKLGKKRVQKPCRIILTILEILSSHNRVGITKITRNANLAYERAQTYLKQLETEEFVNKEVEGRKKFYTITKKGHKFLQRLRGVKTYFESLGFPL